MRIRSNKRLKTQNFIRKKPFQQSVASVVISLIEKALNQVYKGNFKKAAQLIQDGQKDLLLMDSKQEVTLKLKVLVSNTEAILLRKEGKPIQAQSCINQIQKADIQSKALHTVQRAITLLNKCLVFAQFNKRQQTVNKNATQILKSMDQQVQRINILNQAFQLLTNKSPKQLMSAMPKYNQLLIIFFCNLANQLAKVANRHVQARILYQKSYYYSVKVLGQTHRLSSTLLKITQNFKRNSITRKVQSRNKKSPDFCRSKTLNSQDAADFQSELKIPQVRSKKFHLKRFKNLSANKSRQIQKTYGEENLYSKIYANDPFRVKKSHRISTQLSPKRNKTGIQVQDSQMKELDRIKRLYAPAEDLKKQRKSIRDIILKTKSSFDKKKYLFPKNTDKVISQFKIQQTAAMRQNINKRLIFLQNNKKVSNKNKAVSQFEIQQNQTSKKLQCLQMISRFEKQQLIELDNIISDLLRLLY